MNKNEEGLDNNIYAEKSVIGGLILLGNLSGETAQKILNLLKSGSFVMPQNRLAYKAIQELALEKTPLDLITLDAQIKRNGNEERVGGLAYIAEIIQETPSAANIMNYAKIVREGAIKRAIHSQLQEAISSLNDDDGSDIYQKAGLIETMISETVKRGLKGQGDTDMVGIHDVAKEWTDNLMARAENPEAGLGLRFGLSSLDEIIGVQRIPRGSLFGIGARPKMGKTSLMRTALEFSALTEEESSLVFTLEMKNLQLFDGLVSSRSMVNKDRFYDCNLSDNQYGMIAKSVDDYRKTDVKFIEKASITIDYVEMQVRRYAAEKRRNGGQLDKIFIDHLALMNTDTKVSKHLGVGDITRRLKMLAKETDTVVFLLMQLNRKLEERTDKRPMPSDCRESGSIEEDVDFLAMLYREGAYDDELDPSQAGLTEALLRLNRHGPKGTAHLDMINGNFRSVAPFNLGTKNKKGPSNF